MSGPKNCVGHLGPMLCARIDYVPDLGPADAAHIPRWLESLREISFKASLGLRTEEIREAMIRSNDYAHTKV